LSCIRVNERWTESFYSGVKTDKRANPRKAKNHVINKIKQCGMIALGIKVVRVVSGDPKAN
jgi:hypothetical protein